MGSAARTRHACEQATKRDILASELIARLNATARRFDALAAPFSAQFTRSMAADLAAGASPYLYRTWTADQEARASVMENRK